MNMRCRNKTPFPATPMGDDAYFLSNTLGVARCGWHATKDDRMGFFWEKILAHVH